MIPLSESYFLDSDKDLNWTLCRKTEPKKKGGKVAYRPVGYYGNLTDLCCRVIQQDLIEAEEFKSFADLKYRLLKVEKQLGDAIAQVKGEIGEKAMHENVREAA